MILLYDYSFKQLRPSYSYLFFVNKNCIERRFLKVGFILMNHLSMYFRYFGKTLFEAVSKRGISRLLGRC